MLNRALPGKIALAPQPPTPAVLHKVLAKKSIGSDIASENENDNVEQQEVFTEDPALRNGLSP